MSASIPALCWLNNSELVVVLRDIYAAARCKGGFPKITIWPTGNDRQIATGMEASQVGVVNIESGALVRRWSFGTWRPEVVAATNGCPWIAVGSTTQLGRKELVGLGLPSVYLFRYCNYN